MDVDMDSNMQFYYKDLQVWATINTLAFPCCNNKTPSKVMTNMTRNLSTESEPLFVERSPARFPSGTFNGPLLFSIVKNGWARGTPWNDLKTRSRDNTSYRKVFQITMDKKDEERMTTVF